MRLWILPLATAFIGFVAGCNKSPEGGTPGTNSTFTISGPTTTTTIKQDNKQSVKLTLNRDSNFKKDVKLTVSPVDKLKLDLSKDLIKASDPSPADFTVTVQPEKDAPVADYKVKVTGTPEGGGAPTSVEFTVKVEANK